MREWEIPIRICPRCGEEYQWVERLKTPHNTYLYFVHYDPATRKRRKCYGGPVSAYSYVTLLHGDLGLVLRGLAERGRLKEYIVALLETLEERLESDHESVREEALELLDMLRRRVDELSRLRTQRSLPATREERERERRPITV